MGLGKKLLKTSPVGFAAVKASERRYDDAPVAPAPGSAEPTSPLFVGPGKVPKAVTSVAERLGIREPIIYWAQFKTTTSKMGHVSVVLMTETTIIYGQKRLPIAGSQATVDTSGNTAIAQGWLVKERTDTRQLFLTIESQGDGFVIQLPPAQESIARSIATRINSAASKLAPPVDPVPSQQVVDIPEQIRRLADLRDVGILTDAEFEAKKTDLLARL